MEKKGGCVTYLTRAHGRAGRWAVQSDQQGCDGDCEVLGHDDGIEPGWFVESRCCSVGRLALYGPGGRLRVKSATSNLVHGGATNTPPQTAGTAIENRTSCPP